MRLVNVCFVLMLPALGQFGGCAEGGTGGTGGFVPQDTSAPVALLGQANKGPFADGAAVRAQALTPGGIPGGTAVIGTTADLGRFSLQLSEDTAWLVEVTGDYYSEVAGAYAGREFTVAAVVVAGEGVAIDPNLLTTLIRPRVLQLMSDGFDPAVAVATAESELVAGLAPLIPAPAVTPVFSRLQLLDRTGTAPDPDGNGYLLAVTAILEARSLIDAGAAGAGSAGPAAALTALVDDLANELAVDGALELAGDLEGLRFAAASLDPDGISSGLIALDQTIVAAFANLEGSSGVDCAASQGEVTCTDTTSTPVATPRALSTFVADMNLFLDSDADGVVNRDDDDDDGDGINDTNDPRPYVSD